MKRHSQQSPLVSVIIPTCNRANLARRAIQSALAQTYECFELIVVDDNSTDDTESMVASFENDRICYFKHDANRGASAARNTGIKYANGEYIAFLDDDDEWLSTKLEKQVQYIQKLPESVGMIYCWMDYYNDQGQIVKKHHPKYSGYVFPHVLDGQRIGGCSTLLIRRTVIDKVGGFDESLPRGNDGDFIRRVCLNYEVDFVREAFVKVHIGHGYERITRHDKQGIRNAIKGHSAKLIKFKDELNKYPRRTANIYASLAYHYSRLGDRQNTIAFYWKALTTFPFSLKVYVSLMCSLKEKIVRSQHK